MGLGQCPQYGAIHSVTRLSPAGAVGKEVIVLLCSPDSSEEKDLGAILPCVLLMKWVSGRVKVGGWPKGSGRQHPRWKGLFGGTP